VMVCFGVILGVFLGGVWCAYKRMGGKKRRPVCVMVCVLGVVWVGVKLGVEVCGCVRKSGWRERKGREPCDCFCGW
jgi:hypothetical protein